MIDIEWNIVRCSLKIWKLIKMLFYDMCLKIDNEEEHVLFLGKTIFRTTISSILWHEFDVTFDSIFERIINIYIEIV